MILGIMMVMGELHAMLRFGLIRDKNIEIF